MLVANKSTSVSEDEVTGLSAVVKIVKPKRHSNASKFTLFYAIDSISMLRSHLILHHIYGRI